jgi:hypothetical protein
MENGRQIGVRRLQRNLLIIDGLVIIAMFLVIGFIDIILLAGILIACLVFTLIIIFVIRHDRERNKLLSKKYPFSTVHNNRWVEAKLVVGEIEKHELNLRLRRISGKGLLSIDGAEKQAFTRWNLGRKAEDVALDVGETEKHKIVIQGIGSNNVVNIIVDGSELFFFSIY